MTRSSRDK